MDNQNTDLISIPDPDRMLNFACELGMRLIKNGAEIYRVEESIKRLTKAYGYENTEVFAIPAFIILNIEANGKNYTKSIRVKGEALNLERLRAINSLCRNICRDPIDIEEAEKKLNEIIDKPTYNKLLSFISYGFVATFFTLFWGGSLLDAVIAFVGGALVKVTVSYTQKQKVNLFFANIISSSLLAVIPSLLSFYTPLGIHLDKIIIGTIMLLVPGVAITNVMRDILAGDMLTAVTKLAEVMIVAIGIALGIALPITIFKYLPAIFM